MPAVCPQVIPPLKDKNKALRYMTVGRYNYLSNLFKHLQDQSEDCLYLNIFTPSLNGYAGRTFFLYKIDFQTFSSMNGR